MTAANDPDYWYHHRDELEMGMIFNSSYGIVKLEGYVPGDGTQMYVANWDSHNKSWCYYDSTIEPGDLTGEPLSEESLKAASNTSFM